MLTRIRKSMETKDSGFTLIELLVVMIIIGILAAIAIPVFLNQRKSGVDAGVKSDLRQIATDAESIFTDTQVYPAAMTLQAGPPQTVTLAGSTPLRVTTGNVFTYVRSTVANTDAFCISGYNPKGKRDSAANQFVYISSQGGMQPAATVVCPAAGAIT